MKIAMIGARGIAAKYSGIETHLEELCPRLVERGHEVVVYSRNYFTNRRQYRGVKILPLPTVHSKHLETLLHSFVATMHSLQSDADIVHFHAQGSAVFSLLPRLSGKRTVVTVQGLDWQRDKWGKVATWCLKRAEQASAVFPNAVIVVSRALRDYYAIKYATDKVCYVPNGVNIPEPVPPNRLRSLGLEPDRYILFVGRLTPEKGCHHLVEAYQNLGTELKLAIAGAPAYTDSYAKELQKYANGKIRFLGPIYGDLLAELYSNAHLFVLPSMVEGLSIALLEAMSYGCCVIASDIPPNAEVAGKCGLLFSAGDTDSLKIAMSDALASPHIVRQLGSQAKEHVGANYNWDSVVQKTEFVYSYTLGDQSFRELDMFDAV